MWYFTWILGLGLALSFATLNAIWYEIRQEECDCAEEPQKPV